MKLNEKIMKLRKERGLSQEELGEVINVSRQAISKWENGATKPDIDKIKELAQFFNVSFDYLLNDEIDDILPKENNVKQKKKSKIVIVIFVIALIYLFISVYKFIALYRYYKIADSFSEENYSMTEIFEQDGVAFMNYHTMKVGNKVIKETSNPYEKENLITNENGEIVPYDIEFIDYDKKEWYNLTYDNDTKKYTYSDKRNDAVNEEELEKILNGERNWIKEFTIALIPSDFKTILLTSLNPMYQVSISRNEIYVNYLNRMKINIILTQDGLIESYTMLSEFEENLKINLSYDYVQDHFSEIQSPLEKYSEKIENYSEINN